VKSWDIRCYVVLELEGIIVYGLFKGSWPPVGILLLGRGEGGGVEFYVYSPLYKGYVKFIASYQK
jgi:hypothetical protein